ncbi:hypothetical protein V7793_37375 [Streptomyces sp. KLMMK]|uniref:hypothetical protein n=1 Tax=Streptomyces sp. KLMMK TaxID=3109353 RepID=UPI00300A9D0E
MPSLVVIGAGPRCTGRLERIAANAPGLLVGARLGLHLVESERPRPLAARHGRRGGVLLPGDRSGT